MYVCLVSASTVAEFSEPIETRSSSVQETACEPQLGILSLAAVLEQSQKTPAIVDLNRTFLSHAKTSNTPVIEFAELAARDIAAKDANLYGFSTICSSYPLTLRIAQIVKQLRPASKILLGGPQASVVDRETLSAFPFVDFILRGEAEESLPLLLDQLEGSRLYQLVPGLTYRNSSEIRRNLNAPVIADLDSIPPPAYHLTGELQGEQKAALELGRGCPFACTFCSTNDFFRRNFRLYSPGRVLRDMRSFAATYGIRHFDLVHDMFTIDRRRVVSFCEAMINSGDGFSWSCSARTDRIDEELLALMSKAGCQGIFFGVETGSQRMQKIIDKHLDIDEAKKVVDATERAGIRTTVSLIAGFPEETEDDLRQTIGILMHSARAPKAHPQLNLLAPLAATPIYEQHKNELVLEPLCSSLSHQGQSQNATDIQLIREFPEIFPNFYVIPTRHLDQTSLFELREFVLIGMACFRWLLVAIDRNTAGLWDFFLDWRRHRLQVRPGLEGFSLRQYYRTKTFQADFLSLVRTHAAGTARDVKALLDLERKWRRAALEGKRFPNGRLLAQSAALRSSDKPVRCDGVLVVELGCDIQQIIDALKDGRKPTPDGIAHFYATRATSSHVNRLDRVSDWMAYLLRLCNGQRRVDEIVACLSAQLTGIQKRQRRSVCMRLMSGAQAEKFIDIYRRTPTAH